MSHCQSQYHIRCEWGKRGVETLAPISDAVIIVDVMSFSTCVSIAVSRGAIVFPFIWSDQSAAEFAASHGAELARPRGSGGYSLSPRSLLDIPNRTRLVLPSPNGSTLSLSTGSTPTFGGCLRNCTAVAEAASAYGPRIAVIPAGEQWLQDDSLRPAIEDILGAGAIIRHLEGPRSPEAAYAEASFMAIQDSLLDMLRRCASGVELTDMGFAADIDLSAQVDTDATAPLLSDHAFVNAV
jgi:2-phosphosulfolactate phosphatase